MKTLAASLMALISVSTFSVYAQTAAPLQYVCKQIPPEYGPAPYTMILTQAGSGPIQEGKPYVFQLQVLTQGRSEPVVAVPVRVITEDVNFFFKSADNRISGRIYLDELDQTSLSINSREFEFDCR